MHAHTLLHAPAMATLYHTAHDPRPPTPPSSPPPLDDKVYSRTYNSVISYNCQDGGRCEAGFESWPGAALKERETRASTRSIERSSLACEGEGACEGGQEAAAREDVVLIRDEVCAAARGITSATVGGGEHAAASRRSCCHDAGRAAVLSAAACGECVMKHKCGALLTLHDHADHAKSNASMAASDAPLQQQPAGSGSAMVTSSSSSSSSSGAPLRSALKRAGQKSRGHRVCINEAKNECLEADYVIVVHEESEPQLVSIRSFDLSLAPGSAGVEQVTLSPPEGYKDCFTHALHDTILDDSGVCDLASEGGHLTTMARDTESGSGDGLVDPDAPRPHLPDLVTHRTPLTQLTVENVRHHDQLMQGHEQDSADPKVAKTGILKGGKLWKNGDSKKTKAKVEEEEVDEPRRSVRFSGRDEYSLLENLPLDKIPLDAANSAALARFMPKLRELGMLLGEGREDWHVELSPIKAEPDGGPGMTNADNSVEDQQKQLPPPMDDEQIKESMQRYDEMRRRIAAAEGRDNTSVCSDESKSSSDSQSSDSTMTETRIRRLENADIAHVAGGVMRSNSEVRRAIERNALRRSLIRFSDARKKDTNKNDKSDKVETSLLEKLKWLTASEDATNGNSEHKDDDEDQEGDEDQDEHDSSKSLDPKVQETIAQYRKLAEMFNKTTSLRATDILVPRDVREWKLQADLFPDIKGPSLDSEGDELTETHSGSTTPTVFQAIPAVSIADLISDEENDKLIYSGGVRYTREGTLPPASEDGEEVEEGQQAPTSGATTSDVRKQFLSQMSSHSGVPIINGISAHPGDRSSLASNSDSYTFDDIDEALHDDRSSSVPSSSQSSPRLSGKSDMDGTSTTESGYSSNETNGELCPVNGLPMSGAQILGLPAGGVDIDELAEFVRQDAGRMERLRRRYDAGELEDHGFIRRPSVRGIKPRFGSTTDLLKQMATQLTPPTMAQPGMAGSHMTWPYRDVGDEDSGPPQRRRASTNRAVLPALQEDMLYVPTSDLSPQASPLSSTSSATITSLTHTKAPRVVHVYASTGDLRGPPPPRLVIPRESPPPDLIRPGVAPVPVRAHSLSLSQGPLDGPMQGMIMAPQMPTPVVHEHHYQTCRRPASVHGHLPPDSLVTRGLLQPPATRPHSSLSHYPNPRVPVHYHPYEEPPPARASYEGGHPPLAQRGSYPGTIPAPIPSHYQPPMIPHDPARYPNPPPYGSQHPHSRPLITSPREGAPYARTVHPQMHSVPQVSSMPIGSVQVHQCGPRHPPHARLVGGGTVTDQACSPVWSHQQSLPPHPHIHQNYLPHTVSSHLSYTTPIVPESISSTRPSGTTAGPMINGSVGKLEVLRDERGVPEGASSSPRGPVDPQYTPSHGSPTRDAALMHRLPPPVNMT
ncbi:uncharacterized protein [Procambarus clarkii]|uniref:uncharacterized protein isoform X2 n=1 Tax=Procambarus clarkii TaxID=6728 RepID=UPI001E6734CD|nr:uncharacterized protein LOC123774734 isoform X2 [Procambarus clarkii]